MGGGRKVDGCGRRGKIDEAEKKYEEEEGPANEGDDKDQEDDEDRDEEG